MANITCYDNYGNLLSHLTQWDTNQKIIVRGIETTPVPTFRFSNNCCATAMVVKSYVSNTEVTANIPNILLQQALPIKVYVNYEFDDGSSQTRHIITIRVIPSSMPNDYEFTENIEYTSWVKLEEEARLLISKLENYSQQIIISDTEPIEKNILWFDTGKN